MELTKLLNWLTESAIYAIFWIVIMVIVYILIEKLTSFSVKKELIEDENVALWIMFGSFFIAVAMIISAAIR